MDLLSLKKQFDDLSEQEQYDWLLKQDKSSFMIYLDNDATELHFHVDEDCDYAFSFKEYTGNCAGIHSLFTAMGIEVQAV